MSFFSLPISAENTQSWVKATFGRWAAELRRKRLLDLPPDDYDPKSGDLLRYDGQYWQPTTLRNALSTSGEHYEDISISAGSEVGTAHTLGATPKMIIITKRQGGLVEDGPTSHTTTTFYLKNRGTTAATVSVLLV